MKKKNVANQIARDSMVHYSEAGKGDSQRPTDQQKYDDGYERIFGKKKPKIKKSSKTKSVSTNRVLSIQQVKNVTYKHEDEILGLKSLHPSKIIGAKSVFIYNTKNKGAMIFVASKGETLTISGSSIRGFDVEKSYRKTIKNVLEFFKSKTLFEDIEVQQTAKYKITSHINDDMLIVCIK